MSAPIQFEAASFDVKCKRCKTVIPSEDAITDAAGKLMCSVCNDSTEWVPVFAHKKRSIQ